MAPLAVIVSLLCSLAGTTDTSFPRMGDTGTPSGLALDLVLEFAF